MDETQKPSFPRWVFKKGTGKALPGGRFTADKAKVNSAAELAALGWEYCDSPAAAVASTTAPKTVLSDFLKTEYVPSEPPEKHEPPARHEPYKTGKRVK